MKCPPSLATGITTGTCTAAAANAAARLLCGHPSPESVDVELPSGDFITVAIHSSNMGVAEAVATVQKYAGDDPDVTNGALISVTLRPTTSGIVFKAGKGVGTVTRPGLQIPPGEASINPVPRQMIEKAIRHETDSALEVEVSVEGGEELALKTFNPKLGVVGGISIIGTTGIVRPYCRKAMQTAIGCAMDVAAAGSATIVLVPGNIGSAAVKKRSSLEEFQLVEVGNEWELPVKRLARYHFKSVVVAGHPGKLAKFLNNYWYTHSSESGSAAPVVRDLAEKVWGRSVPHSDTVEGVFAEVSDEERSQLGNCLAEEIARRIREKGNFDAEISVMLVNMAKSIIGTYGDLNFE